MIQRMLGGLTARAFLRRHWQKRPLFVRRAFPGFRGVLDERALAKLAGRVDVESRRVQRRGNRWETTSGPFAATARLNGTNASLLVSGVNLHLRAADALLRRFDFLPQARLDDVMVSYATPGGGVGPHVDSYDVFLLQGPGRRLWRVWNFEKKLFKYEAGRGDLLYLPPGWRHDGVALEPCFTYSIGFRAPRGAELGAAFLDWLHSRGLPDAAYRDPRLAPARHPAAIPRAMVSFAQDVLGKIRWNGADVARFLGEYLTEPKAHLVFRRRAGARRGLRGSRVRLDPKTQLLYRGNGFFINGEHAETPLRSRRLLRELADRRSVSGEKLAGSPLAVLIYRWQRLGYLHLEKRT
jgi:50S ribosomal protein L16 3-hydroxylase